MDNVEPAAARFAMRRFQDVIERSDGAVLSAVRTPPQRRAESKPSERFGDGVHEESKPAKWSSAAVKRSTTRMAFPQRGQCQGAQSGSDGRGNGWRPCSASSVRARGSSCLRKRLESRPYRRMRTKPFGSTWRK